MLYSKIKGRREYLGDDESPKLIYLLYLSFLYIVYINCIWILKVIICQISYDLYK